ncbi:MAG: peptidoglycan editing factor PgeF [Candidatus Moranbacteria bacterium]|nr:peptidoglycan editing factor PgeF [Candidatus Moranbacteria bacterium]
MNHYFKQFSQIFCVISNKEHGSMKLFNPDDKKNKAAFLKKLNIDPKKVIGAHLKATSNCQIIKNNAQKIIPNCDALVSPSKDLFLSVSVADCFAVFFFEPNKNIIGVAHAGWRGILKGVIENSLEKIKKLGAGPENLQIEIGPGIQSCHFEIQSDIKKHFLKFPGRIQERNNKIFIDLNSIVKEKLIQKGVEKKNITDQNECTFCKNKKYFSFRRDKPKQTQAMLALIGRI